MYLSDVPTVNMDPRLQAVIDAGVPDVQQTAFTPQTITVKLPTFGKKTLSPFEMAAIAGAALLFLSSGRRR